MRNVWVENDHFNLSIMKLAPGDRVGNGRIDLSVMVLTRLLRHSVVTRIDLVFKTVLLSWSSKIGRRCIAHCAALAD